MSQARQTKLFVYTDADGCIYSRSRYYHLCIFLAYTFASKLEELLLQGEVRGVRGSEKFKNNKKMLLQKMMSWVQDIDLTHLQPDVEMMTASLQNRYANYLLLNDTCSRSYIKLLQFIKSRLRAIGYWEPLSAEIAAKANEDLYQYLDGMCEYYRVKNASLGIASHRSDVLNEFFNARNNATGYFVNDIFHLKTQMDMQDESVDWQVNPFLMADIYGKKAIGSAMKSMLENDLRAIPRADIDISALASPRYLYDAHKLSMYYAQAHLAACQNPHAECVVLILDDSIDILHAIKSKISAAAVERDAKLESRFFPKNVTFVWQQYDGQIRDQKWMIKGSGVIDANFRESVLLMAKMCGQDPDQINQAQYSQSETHYDAASQLDINRFIDIVYQANAVKQKKEIATHGLLQAKSFHSENKKSVEDLPKQRLSK